MKFLFAFFLVALTVAGCRSPWNDDEQKQVYDKCVQVNTPLYPNGVADSICACYIEKLVQRFTQNNQRPEEILDVINECAEQYPLQKQ
jgi:hypothetical protein